MSKTRAIGSNPLDAIIPSTPPKPAKEPKAKTSTPQSEKQPMSAPAHERSQKVRATFHIPEHLLNELRDCVVYLSGPPERLTLASLAERALEAELRRLRKKHTAGEAFPKRDGALRGGRPIGS
jgi:hypothetical protein